MPTAPDPSSRRGGPHRRREPLTRERVIAEAIALADDEGIDRLTMRSLAKRLGVEAMSLYHHVDGKDALLDAMVDAVFAEIAQPAIGEPWRAEIRARCTSLRDALLRHPWAVGHLNSRRTPGPETLVHHDVVIGCLRAGGFSVSATALAFATIDAFVYGFVLQEATLPFESGDEAAAMIEQDAFGEALASYPNMVWFTQEVILGPGYSFTREFEPGLDLVLEGIQSRLSSTD